MHWKNYLFLIYKSAVTPPRCSHHCHYSHHCKSQLRQGFIFMLLLISLPVMLLLVSHQGLLDCELFVTDVARKWLVVDMEENVLSQLVG